MVFHFLESRQMNNELPEFILTRNTRENSTDFLFEFSDETYFYVDF